MKKIAISITIFLLALQAANAQAQKGNQNLGVSLGFYSSNSNYNYLNIEPSSSQFVNTKTTGFSAYPNYSYFIANNLDIGASIGFGHETDRSSDRISGNGSEQTYKSYFGSIFLRKYYLYNNKIGIRTGPYFSYQYSNSDVAYTPDNLQSSNNYKGHNYQGGISADFVFYPSSKIGLAANLANLYYARSTWSNLSQTSSSNSVNLQLLNNNLTLSAFYVFN
ncbi:MAG TPA: hypothetical protein VK668_08065 [Mucilaginibacter sp.]|nr:hypothetical protein [Mucilaginibacter sp.]